MSGRDDDLAYGQYHRGEHGQGESTRSFVGDTFKKLKDTYKQQHSQPQQTGQSQSQSYVPGGYGVSLKHACLVLPVTNIM
jgi:phospholipase D1/2